MVAVEPPELQSSQHVPFGRPTVIRPVVVQLLQPHERDVTAILDTDATHGYERPPVRIQQARGESQRLSFPVVPVLRLVHIPGVRETGQMNIGNRLEHEGERRLPAHRVSPTPTHGTGPNWLRTERAHR